MAQYAYPAIFTPEDTGFSIAFPDVEGCFTEGDDIAEGIRMAEDALALMLTYLEDTGAEIPSPSEITHLETANGAFATYIMCDTEAYRRLMNSAAVKKTLTIPAWLNERAMRKGINFSQVLQEALLAKL